MNDLAGRTLGQYRIIERINEGGAAVVYRAYQESMERYVAVKVLKVDLIEQDPNFIERFAREARTVAQLQHPHILPVIDFGQADEFVFLVMVLLEGGTLRTHLRKHGALPLDQCAFLIAQIASALDRAHSRGIVHRDLKPENILMDEDQNAYLTDFGVARILESAHRLTATGLVLGTPHYLSPEQAKGEPADERADVYALGVMLYEMLSSELPFQADTAYGLIFKHISEPPPSIRDLKPDVPEAVEAVILKALEKDPAQRHQSALELAEAFVNAMPKAPSISVQAESRAEHRPLGAMDTGADLPSAVTITPSTVSRLTPQRMSEADKIVITERPDDPNIHIPVANGYVHYALRALEDVAGLQATEIILRFARLESLLDDYPPNNMKFDRGYTFKQYADLNHSILNYYGATGKEAVMHIGRLSSRWMVMDQPFFGFTSAALRIMPTAAALRLALNKTADGWRKIWQQIDIELDLKIIEKPDFFLWASGHCPCCAGKRCDKPIGWIFDAGFVEGGMLIKGKLFPVREIACKAKGDPLGVWRIDKKPLADVGIGG